MIDIGALLDRLEDRKYIIRMQPKGCRWWRGEIGEQECENGRVPARLDGELRPPLMLESQDEVEPIYQRWEGSLGHMEPKVLEHKRKGN